MVLWNFILALTWWNKVRGDNSLPSITRGILLNEPVAESLQIIFFLYLLMVKMGPFNVYT